MKQFLPHSLACSVFICLGLSIFSCTNKDIPRAMDCSASDLRILLSTKTNPTGCNTIDGSIVVTAAGGVQPFSYSINGADFQSSNTFNTLGSGDYTLVAIDANQCKSTVLVSLASPNSTLDGTIATTANSGCTTPNGTIMVIALGGVPPYQYQLNGNAFGSAFTFTGIGTGNFSVVIKDSKGCTKTLSSSVGVSTNSVSYVNDIAPLLTTYCNLPSCHATGTGRDFTTFTNVKANSDGIKARTANRSMPQAGSPALSQTQIDLIGCWVSGGSLNN